MFTICTNIPIPSFRDLFNSTTFLFPPNITLNLPSLSGLLNPIYSTISHLNLEILQLVEELQSFQFLTTIMSIIKPLVDFIGGALSSILPKIPGTSINLINLLAMDAAGLYSSIKTAIEQFGISIFSLVPSPMFFNLSIPAIEIVNTVKLILKQYMNMCIGTITGLIGQVTNILHIGNMASLPTLPSLSSIMAIINANLHLPIDKLIALLQFPGFPTISIPTPLIPNFSSTAIEIMEGLNIFLQEMIGSLLNTIMSFVVNALAHFISFVFPTMCLTFTPFGSLNIINPPPPPPADFPRADLSKKLFTGFNVSIGIL